MFLRQTEFWLVELLQMALRATIFNYHRYSTSVYHCAIRHFHQIWRRTFLIRKSCHSHELFGIFILSRSFSAFETRCFFVGWCRFLAAFVFNLFYYILQSGRACRLVCFVWFHSHLDSFLLGNSQKWDMLKCFAGKVFTFKMQAFSLEFFLFRCVLCAVSCLFCWIAKIERNGIKNKFPSSKMQVFLTPHNKWKQFPQQKHVYVCRFLSSFCVCCRRLVNHSGWINKIQKCHRIKADAVGEWVGKWACLFICVSIQR